MTASSSIQRRILSLWFPRLATDRLHRREQKPGGAQGADAAAPLVVVDKIDNALRLSALDRTASALGLVSGQALANARAMLPDLRVRTADAAADLALLERIADWCDRVTPFVALDGPRRLLLDVTGCSHLFGGEQALLDLLRARLPAQGLALRGAVAGTAVAARALARFCDGAVIGPGAEAAAVMPLPVEALCLDATVIHAFRRAGLKTVGQVASRKRGELTARFGPLVVATLDQALGHASAPITPRRPVPDYWRDQVFAEPIATDTAIRATLARLAARLVKALEQQGMGARRLEAAFFRADGAVRRLAVETGQPTRDPAVIERLFRDRLEAIADPLDPGFGFDLIRLAASRVEPAEALATDLGRSLNETAEIGFLIDRLAVRFGKDRLLAFQPGDSHIPEAAWSAVPAQNMAPSKPVWKRRRRAADAPQRPLREFARPEPVDFLKMSHLRWHRVPRVANRLEGPERIAMDWWRQEPLQPARDYFRVEDAEGRRYWIYRTVTEDGAASQWFLHGLFA